MLRQGLCMRITSLQNMQCLPRDTIQAKITIVYAEAATRLKIDSPASKSQKVSWQHGTMRH